MTTNTINTMVMTIENMACLAKLSAKNAAINNIDITIAMSVDAGGATMEVSLPDGAKVVTRMKSIQGTEVLDSIGVSYIEHGKMTQDYWHGDLCGYMDNDDLCEYANQALLTLLEKLTLNNQKGA